MGYGSIWSSDLSTQLISSQLLSTQLNSTSSTPTTSSAPQHPLQIDFKRSIPNSTLTDSINQLSLQPDPLILSQLSLASFSILIDQLFQLTSLLNQHLHFWSILECDRFQAGYYLLHSLPARLYQLTYSGKSSSLLSYIPQPPLFISNLFPQLLLNSSAFAQPSHFLSKISPILLIKHEARLKRQKLEQIHTHLAQRIGGLITSFHKLRNQIQPGDQQPHHDQLVASFGTFVQQMSFIARLDQPLPSSEISSKSIPNLARTLDRLLYQTVPSQKLWLQDALSDLSQPSFISRNWPLLISLPVASYTLTKFAYSYRKTLIYALLNARDTLYGFISGWLIKPFEDILQTLKAGERGGLAIISQDSLPSELASLERMTLDFGREKFGWTDERAAVMAKTVREGNLTELLKVWENEIKVSKFPSTQARSRISYSSLRLWIRPRSAQP